MRTIEAEPHLMFIVARKRAWASDDRPSKIRRVALRLAEAGGGNCSLFCFWTEGVLFL